MGAASPSSKGRSGSGNARRRLDTPNSNSLLEGASSAGRGMRPPGRNDLGGFAEFGPSLSAATAMTPSLMQALADLKDELAGTGMNDRQQPTRSIAGDITPGGTNQDLALSMMTGLKEGFDSLKSALSYTLKDITRAL